MAKKRSKNSRKKIAVYAVLLALVALCTFYWLQYITRPRFVRYPDFGIELPVNYVIHGIDVSRYQSSIDWLEVKQMKSRNVQVGFGFIKATEGTDNVDPYFKRNWKEAGKAGIPRGAYHFFIASKSGRDQAANFIERVHLSPGDLPPVLDVEQINGTSMAQLQIRVAEWLQMVEHYYGVKPIIYTNASFYDKYLGRDFDDYPLWVAHYLVKDKPRVKRNWQFWQHNESGRVNGISGSVDFNVFSGDSSDFRGLLVR